MESGVKCIKWQCWSYDSQDSHWSIFPAASSDWLRPPHVLVCESMLLWPRVTPVTSVNTRHKLFSSQFTKLPGVTNQHQLTHERVQARAVGEEGSDHMRAVGLGCHNMTNAHTHICNHFVKTFIISTLSCKAFYRVSEKFDSTAAKSHYFGIGG